MIRVDRLGDLALDFEPDQQRLEQGGAGRADPFTDCQRRGQGRDGRVGEQPVSTVGCRR